MSIIHENITYNTFVYHVLPHIDKNSLIALSISSKQNNSSVIDVVYLYKIYKCNWQVEVDRDVMPYKTITVLKSAWITVGNIHVKDMFDIDSAYSIYRDILNDYDELNDKMKQDFMDCPLITKTDVLHLTLHNPHAEVSYYDSALAHAKTSKETMRILGLDLLGY